MTKGQRENIEAQLSQQGDNIKRLLWIMEGNGVDGGVVSNLQVVKKDVEELKKWKTEQELNKGKIDLAKFGRRFGLIWTGLKWAAALAGIPVTTMTLYKWIFE